MSGERDFVLLSTIGRGNVPYLPLEIRQIIFRKTFPRSLIVCNRCKDTVLMSSFTESLVENKPYTKVGDDFTCISCISSPIRLPGPYPIRSKATRVLRIYLLYRAFTYLLLALDVFCVWLFFKWVK